MSIVPIPVCDPVSGVLIVSPNRELRRELMSRVKSERWRLMEAVSGAHALGQLESEEFQLLLLDPSLPDLNSSEFQKLVRAQFPHLQILPLDRQTGLPLPSSTREDSAKNSLACWVRTWWSPTHQRWSFTSLSTNQSARCPE